MEQIQNGLPGEGEISSFSLDIGRIMGNFPFFIVPVGTLGVYIPSVREGSNFFYFGRREWDSAMSAM